MVGLYKDPKGETISTFATSGGREETAENRENKNETELNKLRHRVIALETILKSQVRSMLLSLNN